jgi:hypothetical protein
MSMRTAPLGISAGSWGLSVMYVSSSRWLTMSRPVQCWWSQVSDIPTAASAAKSERLYLEVGNMPLGESDVRRVMMSESGGNKLNI